MRYFELGPDDAVTIQTPAGPVTVKSQATRRRDTAKVKISAPLGLRISHLDAAEVKPVGPPTRADHAPIKFSARRTGTRQAAP